MSVLYRIHSNLLINSRKGIIIPAGEGCTHELQMIKPDMIAHLLKQGSISLVQAPRLGTFARWTGRERRLDKLGIDTIGFITMDAHAIAFSMLSISERSSDQADEEQFNHRVDNLAVAVQRWQAEIKEYLGIGSVNNMRR